MTLKELFLAMPGKPMIHNGQVFFDTRDIAVAQQWADRGCRTREFYPPEVMALAESNKRRREPLLQGWEVHVLGCIRPRITEYDEDGDEVDITREVLLNEARERL